MATLYERLQATSLRLITKYGRDVTLQLAADSALPDTSKPWEPAEPTMTSYVTRAVIFPVEQQFVDGTTVLGTDEQALVAAVDLPAVPDAKTMVLDGDANPYTVVKVEPIKTGPLPLVYTLFLRR